MSVNQNNLELGATPIEPDNLVLRNRARKSAGLPGITQAIKHVIRHMHTRSFLKTSFSMNQKGGFDCPGCAWPDPDDDRSRLGEFCENGIKAIAEEVSKYKLDRVFFQQNTVSALRAKSDYELGKLGRLTEPLAYDRIVDKYLPVSWDQAFKLIANELIALQDPNQAIFYTSGRTSNEAAYLYQLFVRCFGTNNLPDCSNMCHESSGKGLSETLGIGKGSVTLQDIYEAEVIIIMGQNPGTNHPRMLTALEQCKTNGGKIISVNPLPEAGLIHFLNPQKPMRMLTGGTAIADLHLPVRINGDVALLKAIIYLLFKLDNSDGQCIDYEFIQKYTVGYDAFAKHIDDIDFAACVEASGVTENLIQEAAALLCNRQKVIVCWAMGLTQHENGVNNIKEIVNLLLLKGAIGKPGAGTCPVRGHSNVQGDRTVGIWEAPPEKFLEKLDEVYNTKMPRQHGFAVVDAIQDMHKNPGRIFVALGGNFLSAAPDTYYTAKALKNCGMTVSISTKLNRTHLIHGQQSIILPCLGRTEIDYQAQGPQFVSVENSMGIVHSSQGILTPCSDNLLSEVSIVSKLANETLVSDSIPWLSFMDNYDLIRDEIEQVIPGFENYNQRVRQPGGFYLPNGARERKFNTSSGKAHFSINELPNNDLVQGQYEMMTIRSHDQFNTTIYGLDDRYRGIHQGRRVVLMNSVDMELAQIKPFDEVNLVNNYNKRERIAERFKAVPYDIPARCIATYFPEANILVPIDKFAKSSKTPCSKRVIITIKKI